MALTTKNRALRALIDDLGSQVALARVFRIARSNVTFWLHDNGMPPAKALEIERLSNGYYLARDLVKQDRKCNRFYKGN